MDEWEKIVDGIKEQIGKQLMSVSLDDYLAALEDLRGDLDVWIESARNDIKMRDEG